jgi:ATP/maltotriose-dependent transcriptional regulator MalT
VLGRLWAEARGGRPRLVLVEGEAGVGKTALLRRFAGDATGLWASGSEDEAELELGLVHQLLAAIQPGSDRSRLPAVAGEGSLAVGARLLTAVGELGQHRPVALVVDDANWADPASARALLFALRRLRGDPVLVVAAARPRTMDRLGEGWARMLADRRLATVIGLSGLDAERVRELAAASGVPLPAVAAERLRAHTGGNPLYVRALLDEVPAAALRGKRAELPAPHSYAATVLALLARLAPPARELVAAVAVLGAHARLRLAAAMCGVEEPIGAAEEAADAGLLQLTGDPAEREVDFVHPLTRAAVYDDLAGPRRRSLHRAAAEVLEGVASLRHRVMATDGVDAELAGELRAAAERDVAGGALQSAAGYFDLASRVEPDPRAADECLFRAVESLLVAADMPGVLALEERVRAAPPSAYRRFILAMLNAPTGQLAHSIAELHTLAESVTPDENPRLYAGIAAGLAYFSAMLDDHQGAIRWAASAADVAGAQPVADNSVRQALVWSYAGIGRIGDALALLADCSPEHARPAPFETDLLEIRGVIHTWVGALDAALADLRAVVRWVGLGYSSTNVVLVYAALGEAEFRSGAWDQAATHTELAISLAEDLDQGWHLAYAHAVAAQLYAAQGEQRLAAGNADSARKAAGIGPVSVSRGYAALAEAHRAWALGDWPAVQVALRPLLDAAGQPWVEHPNLAAWRYRLAEAWIGEGRPDEALGLLDRAPAEPWGGTTASGRGRLCALALHRRGDTAAAREAFERGMAGLAGAPATFADALLALDYGRFLIDTGSPAAAVNPLRSAREVFRRLGAVAFRRACDAALRGGEPGAHGEPSAPGLDRLTARERVVARLVADGASNREAAAELYLSVKGIEYHLGNIYAKLGIGSRGRLRAALDGGPHRRSPGDRPEV